MRFHEMGAKRDSFGVLYNGSANKSTAEAAENAKATICIRTEQKQREPDDRSR